MKTARKLIALLMAITLLCALWAPTAVSAAQEEELLYFGRSILAQMEGGETLCYAYDALVEGIANHDEEVDVTHATYQLDWDDAGAVYDMVRADHPEFFYVSYISYGGGEYVTYFRPNYQAELESYLGLVEHRTQVLTHGLEGKSDYEKSLILHDRLCDAVKYNLDSAHNQNVISSLVLGETVCAGYARAYQLLMQAVGIPCYYVVGIADNGVSIGGHAWNLVQLDGEWYYTDVTWDDQNDDGGNIYYSYLNVTYDQIATDHFAEEYAEYLPHSTATAANFYAKNGLTLSADTVVVIPALAETLKTVPSLQFYCPESNPQDFISYAFSLAYDVGLEMTGSYEGFSVDSLGILGNVLVINMVILHDHTYVSDTIPACEYAPGTVTNRCTTCGYIDKQTLDAVGHQTEWQIDEMNHRLTCIHCGATEQEGRHTYTKDGVHCDTCGYENRNALREGDVNGDGKVNNRDLGLLQKYINAWDVEVTSAADMNGDGKVNNRDLGLLQKLLNG